MKTIRPLLLAIPILACSVPVAPSAELALETEDEKTFYALGQLLSGNLGSFSLTEAELASVVAGLEDGVMGREPRVDVQVYAPKIQGIAEARAAVALAEETQRANTFLEAAAKETGVQKQESGLLYTEVAAGAGATPTAADKVSVHYHGTLTDGSVFDSSVDRGEPVEFPLGGVIPCWTEGLQLMKVGGKGKLVCPAEIAYGDRGAPPRIKPGAALVFEVELLSIAE